MAELTRKDEEELDHALITRHNREGLTIPEAVSNIVDRHLRADRRARDN